MSDEKEPEQKLIKELKEELRKNWKHKWTEESLEKWVKGLIKTPKVY